MAEKQMTTGPKRSIVVLLIVATLAAASIFIFDGAKDSNTDSTLEKEQTSLIEKAVVANGGKQISYDGVEGRTALELVKQYTKAETKTFSGLGEYVVGINAVVAEDGKNFWSFYVNGSPAQVGAGDYVTKTTDKIEWRLEDVTTTAQ